MKYGQEDISKFWFEFKHLMTNSVDIEKVISKYESKIILNDFMFSFALNLKKKYRLLALANESKYGVDFKIKKFNLNNLFEKIYCSAYLNMAKPNKDIYEYVINDSNLILESTIFVDNQIENISAAESLGLKSILFKDLNQLKLEFSKYAIKY
jgi:FMN phosphatase YigB (HAD superfamily)